MSEVIDEPRPQHMRESRAEPLSPPPPGPILQSVVIGFRVVYGAIALLAILWLVSNVRQIAPDSQAVVMRFGRIDRAQDAGLLLAWPRPIEAVRMLPGPDRQLSQAVGTLPPTGGIILTTGIASPETVRAAPFLTGDGNIVLLDATLLYRITDARAYVLSEAHVAPALDRMFRAAEVSVAARRNLNDFLVARAGGASDRQSVMALRGAVLDDLVREMATRLEGLAHANASLGVEIQRIDMTALLPPEAKIAFDAVLTATQAADQAIAAARTAAEKTRQDADRERDAVISAAQATAQELVATARVDTAPIAALAADETPATHDAVVLRAYRDRVAVIMSKIGSVTLVDPSSEPRLVLPGRQ